MSPRDRRGAAETPRAGPRIAIDRALALTAYVAFASVALASCVPEDPFVAYVNRHAVAPSASYVAWWDEVEACARREGDFRRVAWYEADLIGGGQRVLGQWRGPHEITIRSDQRDVREVVQHEILHDLLAGDGAHVDDAWTRCNLPTGIG